jgi:cysteine desulfurase
MPLPHRPIYLDYASTTPVHPRCSRPVEPYLRQEFGNPSNLYGLGRRAGDALERARAQVAAILGSHEDEIVFTGGGSESDNLALKGVALATPRRRHLVTTTIEHSAVLGAARDLQEHWGMEVTYVPVDERGIVDPAAVVAALRPDTCLVSVMLANNEIGTIQPVAEIARACRARGVPIHTDAVQAAGFLDLNVDRLGVDLLSLSGHKVYAPKGVGVLYVRRDTPLVPLIHGGSQEGGRRAGTQNVAGIVGCGVALELVEQHRAATCARLTALRDRLIAGIEAAVPARSSTATAIAGCPAMRTSASATCRARRSCSSWSTTTSMRRAAQACHAGSQDPSHVLLAIGRSAELAHTAVRLTLGAPTTEAEIDRVLELLPLAVERVRDQATVRR